LILSLLIASPPAPDFQGEDVVYVPAMSHVVDLNGPSVFIDPVNDPIALGPQREISGQ
jgi:hypothetical protein